MQRQTERETETITGNSESKPATRKRRMKRKEKRKKETRLKFVWKSITPGSDRSRREKSDRLQDESLVAQ